MDSITLAKNTSTTVQFSEVDASGDQPFPADTSFDWTLTGPAVFGNGSQQITAPAVAVVANAVAGAGTLRVIGQPSGTQKTIPVTIHGGPVASIDIVPA